MRSHCAITLVRATAGAFCILGLSGEIAFSQPGGEPPAAQAESARAPAPGVREYAPGVRIDWGERAVEIDAKVVLREGALELLACSPHTREHESIFVVASRPLHIHQALGLIGLEPGRPVRYDEQTDRWFAPFGEPLSISVKCEGGRESWQPARTFLKLADKEKSPEAMDWVWAGSRVLPDGRFGADLDGTVICVVDFDTAMITVGAVHTSDDEALWLEAHTAVIPPVGTPCVLRVSSRSEDDRPERSRAADEIEGDAKDKPDPLTVEIAEDDLIRLEGDTLTIDQFVARLEQGKAETARPALRVRVAKSISRESVDRMLERLRKQSFDRITIEFSPQDIDPPKPPEPTKNRD